MAKRQPVDALAGNRDRNGLRQHQRFVADVGRKVTIGIDHDRPAQASAIAAAEHDRRLAEIAQQFHQREHGRRLAGTADVIVADAKYGNAGVKALALQTAAATAP